jgi:hypothetical protein
MACARHKPVALAALLGVGLLSALSGCRRDAREPSLSGVEKEPLLEVPVPPADGPMLGSVKLMTPILARPEPGAARIGYLRAGARVARSVEAFSKKGCARGWYAVRPRGFVCLNEGATLDLAHPTLSAMALQPHLDEPLPYTYARATATIDSYAQAADRGLSVKRVSKLPRHSAMAIVGSWRATNEDGLELRLGLLTDGTFVEAQLLEPVAPPEFSGFALAGTESLPVAFVVKRGIRTFELTEGAPKVKGSLAFHQKLELTGRFRTVDKTQYWALKDGSHVRHQDITLVRSRHTFPEFVTDDAKWIDVSVATGTMVLYEGKKPCWVTLVSVGRDRLAEASSTAVTKRGTFEVVAKHITQVELDPSLPADGYEIRDLPWAVELSSGQLIHAAFWHERFGIENGPGNLQLSPKDAAHVFTWVSPALPEGWHSSSVLPGEKRVTVVVR